VLAGLSDEAWRVREMCAKVARLRELGEAGDALSTLVHDETTRVRVAAIRALALAGEAEHADAVREARDDPEPAVRKAAMVALKQMADRLDRPL
jgi:HEAT repeat protein